MRKDRLRVLLVCLVVVAMVALGLAGGLFGCKKTDGQDKEDGEITDGQGDHDTTDGITGNVVAFVHGNNVYLANADGSGWRQLTTSAAGYGDLAFSPSGKKLAATRVEGDALPQLVVIDVASGKVSDVSWTNPEYSEAWSAVGVQPWNGGTSWATEDVLYCTGMKESGGQMVLQLLKYDLAAHKITVVEGDAQNPSVSPDGSSLAYIRKPTDWAQSQGGAWESGDPGDLIIRALPAGGPTSLMANMRGYVFEAIFSTDNKHMAVIVFDEPDTTLVLTDMQGTRESTLRVVGPGGLIGHPSFSPAGDQLVAHYGWRDIPGDPYKYTVFVVPTDQVNPPATDIGEATDPAWSPAH